MQVPIVSVRQVLAHAARTWSPPAAGLLYFVSWLLASTNPFGDPRKVPLYALFAIAIGISGRFPMTALGLLVATPALQIAEVVFPPWNTTWPTYLSAPIVAFFVGWLAPGARKYIALSAGAVASVLIAYSIVTGGVFSPLIGTLEEAYGPHPLWWGLAGLSLAVFGLCSVGWILGFAGASLRLWRTLQVTEIKLEESDFELRLSQVREGVARDVHDALAHSLAIVVAQAEGGAAVYSTRPDAAVESLHTIATVSRTALVDVRRLVEKIQAREDDLGERPSISDITPLLQRWHDSGMHASLEEIGAPRTLGSLQELAVYRIVQESLTNALKHSGAAAAASVTLVWSTEGVSVRIASEAGAPLIPAGATGRGVGIAGMEERALLAGGWLDTSVAADGSFVVTAFIPAPPTSPEDDHPKPAGDRFVWVES
jgi:signal transduction histidine kinase